MSRDAKVGIALVAIMLLCGGGALALIVHLWQGTAPATAGVGLEVPAFAVAGTKVPIRLVDPGRAGRRVKVVAQSQDGDGEQVIAIDLDESGAGSVQWTAPDWHIAVLRCEGAPARTLVIGNR